MDLDQDDSSMYSDSEMGSGSDMDSNFTIDMDEGIDLSLIQDPESRECLVRDILKMLTGRDVMSLELLGGQGCDFVYLLHLEPRPFQGFRASRLPRRPGTVELTLDVSVVVMRIPCVTCGADQGARVENEVAAMSLMRDALGERWESIIPKVYGWGPTGADFGWILEEYKSGEVLGSCFNNLAVERKQSIIGQLADVYKLIQSYKLPNSVWGYGGLVFNEAGRVVTGRTSFPCGGSFESLPDMYAELFHQQLRDPSATGRWNVWSRNGLGDLLVKFALSNRIVELVRINSVNRPTLVHGHLETDGILFDPKSNQITALTKFNYSHIASPVDEYFYSFHTLHSFLPSVLEPPGLLVLRKYLLEGFDGNVPAGSGGREGMYWKVAAMMDEEFTRAGVSRPKDIPGSGELANLRWFLHELAPSHVSKSPERRNQVQAEVERALAARVERGLWKCLLRWWFNGSQSHDGQAYPTSLPQ